MKHPFFIDARFPKRLSQIRRTASDADSNVRGSSSFSASACLDRDAALHDPSAGSLRPS